MRLHRLSIICLGACLATASPATDTYHVVVTNERSGDLSVFAAPSHTLVATIPVGKRPRGVCVSADGRILYVALSGSPIAGPPGREAANLPAADKAADGIGVVDFAARRLLRTLKSGSDPEQLALSRDERRLYVTNEDIGAVSVIATADGRREHLIAVGEEPEGVAINPAGTLVYAACETLGDIHAIDTVTHRVVAKFTVGGRPRTIAFLADGTRALIPAETDGLLHVIDAVQHRVLRSIPLPKGSLPMCVQLSADNRRAFVSTGRGGTVCVIDLEHGEVSANIKVGARPWGLALSPDGRLLYTANGPSNDVSVVDVAAGKEIARLPAGTTPWGVVVVP